MSEAADRPRCITELEHAVADGFPSQSTVVAHGDDASGRPTIQVSWVRVPAEESAHEWRCAVDLRFASHMVERYAWLDAVDRLHVRTHLCDGAWRAVDRPLSITRR